MDDQSAPTADPGRLRWFRFAIPLVTLFGVTALLSVTTGMRPGLAVAVAAVVGAVLAAFTLRKLAVPLILLAALSWSASKSELDPLLLVNNRDRAVEYVFGRTLTDSERELILGQAERTARVRLRSDAERLVRDELGLERGDERPANFDQMVEVRASELRTVLTDEEWTRRINRAAARTERERKGGFFPIETDPESIKLYLDSTMETVAIAVWGTLLAFVTALPASLFASKRSLAILSTGNSVWQRAGRNLGIFLTRRGFDACRGFNEFVLALIFVAVIGLGPFAGVLALAVHTFGVLGKVFADALDTIAPGEVEGVQASGAPPAHVISFAVLPQVFPIVISQSLLRFESNVRSASVLGLVGAGGVGFLIDAKLKAYQFSEVATIMLIIIVLVSLIDFCCSKIVRRFV